MTLPDPAHWRQLSPLLDELLALDSPDRRARLTGLAAVDAALAAELAGLLDAGASARGRQFLGGTADGDALPLPGPRKKKL